MNNQQEQEFDSFIKNGLNAIPVEMPQNAWTNFASRLAGNQKKYWIWTALSATTLLMSLFTYNYLINKPYTTNQKQEELDQQNFNNQNLNIHLTIETQEDEVETLSTPMQTTTEEGINENKSKTLRNSTPKSDSLTIQTKTKADKNTTDSVFIFW
jgi:hypothetical protein